MLLLRKTAESVERGGLGFAVLLAALPRPPALG